jgi:ssDNA-binding Zn-finger/Zn-ribbon topoisomerase 1
MNRMLTEFDCPSCKHSLVRRKNRYGYFWGCRNYPDCQMILPDEQGKPGKRRQKAQSTGEACPECGQGERVERTIRKGQRRGQTFIGCSRFPACTYTEFV